MNRKKLAYKAASLAMATLQANFLAMAACMTVGMTSALTGCGSKKNETITLENILKMEVIPLHRVLRLHWNQKMMS